MKNRTAMPFSKVIVQPGCEGEVGAHVFQGKGSGHKIFDCMAMPHVKTRGHAAAIGHMVPPDIKLSVCSANCAFSCL